MSFVDPLFLFVFIPTVLILSGLATWVGVGHLWLITISSFVFFAWFKPIYVLILASSVLFNYLLGRVISKTDVSLNTRRYALSLAISFNLALLLWFKYFDFFLENSFFFFGLFDAKLSILLPVGISFFTFQQIAYLVDTYNSGKAERDLVRYAAFVSFFPQLIAGPIVRANQLLPQLRNIGESRFRSEDLSVGLVFITIGLCKKVLIADNLSLYVDPLFAAVDKGQTLSVVESWYAMLGYSFQLYFDFSGYCDIAIGLARIWGIKLPINFNSPYKSENVVEFWTRWNITLSQFLRDYLYIKLGGNRRGSPRHYSNLLVTMLLGGLWHGASWNFVAWGAIHGLFIMVAHALRPHSRALPVLPRPLKILITFMLVTLAWVPFRANTFDGTTLMFACAFGGCATTILGIDLLSGAIAEVSQLFGSRSPYVLLATAAFIAFFLPNSNYYGALVENIHERSQERRLIVPAFGFVTGTALVICLTSLSKYSTFIYFQF